MPGTKHGVDASAGPTGTGQDPAEALRRSEASFRKLLELTPDGVAVHRDGRFIWVNRATLDILGYEGMDALVGRPLLELFPPYAHANVIQGLAGLLATQESTAPVEAHLLHRDGSIRYLELSTFLMDFDGEPAFVAVGRDLTERRRMEAQLALADRMVSMGTLAAGVAHEVSNPLTYALHNVERLGEDLPRLRALWAARSGDAGIDAAMEGLVDRAQRAAHGLIRVREIVRDLKRFTRVDDEVAPVQVQQALEAAVSMAHNEMKYRARLVMAVEPTPPVEANEGRLSQVFLNLLVNAAQAIPEGSAPANEIRVRCWTEGAEVIVEISDTGEGILPQNLVRLFEPFFSTKPAGVGSGLGLSICHSIVTGYGGRIEVSSTPGQGSRFQVRLPVATRVAPVVRRPLPALTPPPIAARILIVDDEPNIGFTLSSLLSPEHQVHLAGSGAEARVFLEQQGEIDVVLCDLMMPDVSGMDLHRWLVEHDHDLAQRMVFMTGGAFTPGARTFLEQCSNPTVEKPFRLDRLTRIIGEILAERGPRGPSA